MDASWPWEVWQCPESRDCAPSHLGSSVAELEGWNSLPRPRRARQPLGRPSCYTSVCPWRYLPTSPCQRLCKELGLAGTLISCQDCSTRAGLPGEGRKKEQQNCVSCHRGTSFVRDASLLSTGRSGLLSCFATWVLLAVTGALAAFELWSSCWVGV